MGCAELVFILTPTPGMIYPPPPQTLTFGYLAAEAFKQPKPQPPHAAHTPTAGGWGRGWGRGGMVHTLSTRWYWFQAPRS